MSSPSSSDTTETISDGAMRALARHGSGLSMTDICRESGVSRGTLYRYFANREEVLQAVNAKILEVNRALFDAAIAARPDPADRVEVMLHTMLDFPSLFPHMKVLFEYEAQGLARLPPQGGRRGHRQHRRLPPPGPSQEPTPRGPVGGGRRRAALPARHLFLPHPDIDGGRGRGDLHAALVSGRPDGHPGAARRGGQPPPTDPLGRLPHRQTGRPIALVSRKSSGPSTPYSRPMPLCL
uniref:TetR/AcrR family transcriptional regulator n=1 Tax=Janibacter limosus TaxID=53458 RepID=A0AC61U5Y5_9MICO|nr:TetR/AcrR family transcriptional regulator [Janibacter limosus]